MDAVPMTTFIDFISKSGTPKMTVVRDWKNRDKYDPARDYYKRLRDGMVAVHQDGEALSSLDQLVHDVPEKKKENYGAIVAAHRAWCRKKKLEWFSPPRSNWKTGGLTVMVNPELGLSVDGVKHVIKLYFKADPLAKSRASLLLHLLHDGCVKNMGVPASAAILDLRKGKMFTGTSNKDHAIQLEGEAAYWMNVISKL